MSLVIEFLTVKSYYMYLCFHMHKQNVKRSAKKLMDCDGSACGTTGCDIRRDLIDIAVDQNVMLRDLNIKAVQLDGIIEVLGVVNTTQTMLFKTEIGGWVMTNTAT